MDDEGAVPGSFTILDLQLSKKTPKLSCRLETKLIEWTMKIRKYLDNEVDNDDFEVDHMYVRKYLGKNYCDHHD